jgi:hypothetical protein
VARHSAEGWQPEPDHPALVADLHAWYASLPTTLPSTEFAEPALSPRQRYRVRRRLGERQRAEWADGVAVRGRATPPT